MEVQPRSTQAEYNKVAGRETRRRFLLIVVLPLSLLFIGICALAVFAYVGLPDQGPGSRSVFAQMATIFLLAPLCLVTTVLLVLTAGMSYGVFRLSGKLPPLFFKVYQFLRRAHQGVERASNAAARPLVGGHARAASVTRFARVLREGPKWRKPGAP